MVVWVVTGNIDYETDVVRGVYTAQEKAEACLGMGGRVYRCEVDVDDSAEEV